MNLNTIRRLTVEGRSVGLDKVERELQAVAAGQREVANTAAPMAQGTETSARSVMSLERQLTRLRSEIDPAFRATTNFERGVRLLDRAFAQGRTDAAGYARDLALLEQRYLTLDRAADQAASTQARAAAIARGVAIAPTAIAPAALTAAAAPVEQVRRGAQLAQHELVQMQAQLTDLTVQIASGGSPFMAIMQQGAQLSPILSGQGGVRGAIAAVGAGFVSLLNPVNLAILGLGAAATAATYFFTSTDEGADQATRAVELHDKAIRGLKEAYGAAAEGADDYARRRSRAIADQKAEDAASANRGVVESVAAETIAQLTGEIAFLDAAARDLDGTLQRLDDGTVAFAASVRDTAGITALQQAIEAMQSSIESGQPDLIGFRETLLDISKRDDVSETVRRIALEAYKAAEAGEEAAYKLADMTDTVDRLSDAAILSAVKVGELRAALGDLAGIAVQPLGDEALATLAYQAGLAAAQTIGDIHAVEAAYLAALERIRTQNVPRPPVNPIRDLTSDLIPGVDPDPDAAADRQVSAYERTIQSAERRLAQMRMEQQAFGLSERAAAALRFEFELLSQAGADGPISAEQAAALRGYADAMAEAAEQTRRMQEAQRQAIETMDDIRGFSRDLLGGFLDDLRNGASLGETFLGVLNRIAERLVDLFADRLIADLFGAQGTGPGGALGPYIGQLLGIGMPANDNRAGGYSGLALVGAAVPSVTNPFSAIGSGQGAPATGSSVEAAVWNFFTGKGLAPHQVAGIMGHVGAESAFNPTAIGDGGNAFGLFQWNDRAPAMLDFIGGRGNLGDVQRQLEFAWHELMTSEGRAMSALLGATDVRGATAAFGGFERPAGFSWGSPEGMHNWVGRLAGAESALARFGETTSSATASLGSLGQGFNQFGSALSSFQPAAGIGAGSAGGGGGLFGWLGSLFGGFGGIAGAPNLGIAGGLYDIGGYTGPGGRQQVAGLVHRGEYVFDAASTSRIGVGALDAMRAGALRGYEWGGPVGLPSMSPPANSNAPGVSPDDLRAAIADLKLSPTIIFVDDKSRIGDYVGSDDGIDTIATGLRKRGVIG